MRGSTPPRKAKCVRAPTDGKGTTSASIEGPPLTDDGGGVARGTRSGVDDATAGRADRKRRGRRIVISHRDDDDDSAAAGREEEKAIVLAALTTASQLNWDDGWILKL